MDEKKDIQMDQQPVTPEEPKVVFAYIIKHFEDGSVVCEDANLPDTVRLQPNDMYSDIEDVARTINLRRITDAAEQGVARFFAKMNQQK